MAWGWLIEGWVTPFQGLGIGKWDRSAHPRATPWADILCPFGAWQKASRRVLLVPRRPPSGVAQKKRKVCVFCVSVVDY
jgi:hypothetical protein